MDCGVVVMIFATLHGSTVTILGGKSEVAFDWFEEQNACYECVPQPYPNDGYLVWHCDECGGGRAKLHDVENVRNRDAETIYDEGMPK